ncbi:hypothetical protein ES703_45104 [subsurface metagenome]
MIKKLPKIETINFILRSNKVYQIAFQQGVLTVDDKIVWQSDEESVPPFMLDGKLRLVSGYQLKLEGTGPQNFRQRIKRRLQKGRNSKLVV